MLWQDLVDFLNSQEIGEEISRKEIIKTVNKGNLYSQHSIDKLRRMLTVQGYLIPVLDSKGNIIEGRYRLVKTIPLNLTTSALEALSYPSR